MDKLDEFNKTLEGNFIVVAVGLAIWRRIVGELLKVVPGFWLAQLDHC